MQFIVNWIAERQLLDILLFIQISPSVLGMLYIMYPPIINSSNEFLACVNF